MLQTLVEYLWQESDYKRIAAEVAVVAIAWASHCVKGGVWYSHIHQVVWQSTHKAGLTAYTTPPSKGKQQ